MDLNAAQIFISVVKAGSFSGASKIMGIPVSTVSDRVAQLEKELGVSLLIRTTRSLKLTDVGADFYKKADEAIGQLLVATEEASQSGAKPTGVLRITGPTDFASTQIAAAISDYRARFPQVRVETLFTNRRVDLVREGFDIAIRGGDLEDSSLIAKRLGSGKRLLVSSEKYLKKAPPLKHPKDLLQHSCIRFQNDEKEQLEAGWKLKSADGRVAQVKPNFQLVSTTFDVIIELIKIGEGIGLIPSQLVCEDIQRGRLVTVLPDWGSGEQPVHLVYQPQRFALPKVKEMIPLLESRLRHLMGSCKAVASGVI